MTTPTHPTSGHGPGDGHDHGGHDHSSTAPALPAPEPKKSTDKEAVDKKGDAPPPKKEEQKKSTASFWFAVVGWLVAAILGTVVFFHFFKIVFDHSGSNVAVVPTPPAVTGAPAPVTTTSLPPAPQPAAKTLQVCVAEAVAGLPATGTNPQDRELAKAAATLECAELGYR